MLKKLADLFAPNSAYDLNKQATAYKKAGDWDSAIKCLYQVKKQCGYGYDDMKLAKYLQQAGRFEESIREFEWLLKMAELQCEELFGHNDKKVMMCQLSSRRARIYAGARLSCKREKRMDLVKRYDELAKVAGAISTKLSKENRVQHLADMDVRNNLKDEDKLQHYRKESARRKRNNQRRDKRIKQIKKELGLN